MMYTISGTVIDEMEDCKEPKRTCMFKSLEQVSYTDVPVSDEIKKLGEAIIARGVLPPSSVRDSLHIAAAVIADCDYIVSWNFKHMVSARVNRGMRHIVIERGYKEILLIPPSMLLSDNEV